MSLDEEVHQELKELEQELERTQSLGLKQEMKLIDQNKSLILAKR